MELKHIKELMAAMGRTGTKRLVLKKEGFEIELERVEGGGYKSADASMEFAEETFHTSELGMRRNKALPRTDDTQPPLGAAVPAKEDIASFYVTSPMVGTFYASPSPDEPPFVKVGDRIEKNTVVCIIEAMKVMNEVKAGVTGTVAEVLIESGHPVEFGTKLFRVI